MICILLSVIFAIYSIYKYFTENDPIISNLSYKSINKKISLDFQDFLFTFQLANHNQTLDLNNSSIVYPLKNDFDIKSYNNLDFPEILKSLDSDDYDYFSNLENLQIQNCKLGKNTGIKINKENLNDKNFKSVNDNFCIIENTSLFYDPENEKVNIITLFFLQDENNSDIEITMLMKYQNLYIDHYNRKNPVIEKLNSFITFFGKDSRYIYRFPLQIVDYNYDNNYLF